MTSARYAVAWIGLASLVGWLAFAAPSAGASGWSIETTPNPSGAPQSFLNGVSCNGRTCTAVGQYATGIATYKTLAERRTGSVWRIQTTPNPSGSPSTDLLAVSCRRGACTAVGHSTTPQGSGAPLAEHFSGGVWQIQRTPNPAGPGGAADLLGVSCRGPRFCMAVGGALVNPNTITLAPLAELWNGSSWSTLSVPNPSGSNFFLLSAVSCARRTSCVAVGGPSPVHWNGTTWQGEPLPTPSDAVFITLSAVSCTAPNACTAVGSYNTAGAIRTLAERWDGTSWRIQTTPNPLWMTTAVLDGVSCPTRSDCTAVGFSSTQSASYTLVEHWNGSSWQIEPSPNVSGASSTTLSSVSCTRAGGCTAVGNYATGSGAFTLAERRLGRP